MVNIRIHIQHHKARREQEPRENYKQKNKMERRRNRGKCDNGIIMRCKDQTENICGVSDIVCTKLCLELELLGLILVSKPTQVQDALDGQYGDVLC